MVSESSMKRSEERKEAEAEFNMYLCNIKLDVVNISTIFFLFEVLKSIIYLPGIQYAKLYLSFIKWKSTSRDETRIKHMIHHSPIVANLLLVIVLKYDSTFVSHTPI